MINLRLITIEPKPDDRSPPETPCDALLNKGLEGLKYPPIEPDQPPVADQNAEPYEVQFVLHPKAWGNFPSTKPVKLLIPRAKAQMHQSLRQEAEAAFVLGSWGLVDQLAVGVYGLEQFSSIGEFVPSGKLAGNYSSKKLMDVLRERVSEDRSELFKTYEVVRGELAAKEDLCLSLLQKYALCRAINEELPACDAVTMEEARRYLSLAKTDETTIRTNLDNDYVTHAQSLTGPEGRDLVRVMCSLADPYRNLKAAKDRFEASLPQRNMQKGAVWLTLLGPAGLPMMVANAAEALAKITAKDSERQTAASQLTKASAEFQARFAELAIRYPILFKIADTVDQDEFVWRRRTVVALKDALQASAELTTALGEDPKLVWRFPGLIDRSIRRGFGAESNFASRVASDKLKKENEMPFFAKLNAGIQLLDTTLMLVPYPPVKVGTVIAGVIGDAAELLESYFRTKEQRMGFRAAIDPSHALGPDASYASTMIQGAFVALGLLPIPGALKEWAEEGANATNAARLRKAALMRAQ